TLETCPGNIEYPSTIPAKSPEAYAIPGPTVDVMPIIPLPFSLPAPVRQAPASPR
uniref:Photosystem II protein K n=1 Tax=Megaloselaginella exaltata TaxID=3140882 RepID=A0A7T8FZY4_9TRAC|nr:photosystem II protein K [Selaginella exaltata]